MELQEGTREALYQIMLARYYSSSLGRFLEVDPGDDTDPEHPQSWNKYAYVRNNPLKVIDPKGTQGIPTTQQQMDQMTATATVQQLEPQGRAMEEAAQAATLEAVGNAVCEAAPVVGEGSGLLTVGLLAASPAGGATLPAAGITGTITMVADGVAFLCEPTDPGRVAALGTDFVGAAAAYHTATALERVPGVPRAIKAAFAAVTGELMGRAAQPALEQSLVDVCP